MAILPLVILLELASQPRRRGPTQNIRSLESEVYDTDTDADTVATDNTDNTDGTSPDFQ